LEESFIEKSLLDDLTMTDLSKTLDEGDDASAENNSSAVCLFQTSKNKYLFPGDAGPLSLNRIVEKYPFLTKGLTGLKVPHHGSKKNLSSDLVTHFSPTISWISGNGSRKYPSQAVVNALKKVNSSVFSTHKSGSLWYHINTNLRDDYSNAEQL
jgi:beta-lactamase superfamily II metal-dependent hydrolase